jgi:SAM-dependent methyltransferase
MHEYDLIADWYAADRSHDIGIPEMTALARSLPQGATVLDIGCGTGIPVTRALLAVGCYVFAVDSSSRMIEKFRANFPDIPALCAAIQSCDLQSRTFDAAVAWGVMFHLDDPIRSVRLRTCLEH